MNNATVHDLIKQAALRHPDTTALQYKNESLSYPSLYSEIERVAHGLIARGVQPGDRVAVFLGKTPKCVISFFAITLAGAIFVPINPVLKTTQVAHILDHAGVKLLITNQLRLSDNADYSALETIIVTDLNATESRHQYLSWDTLLKPSTTSTLPQVVTSDLATILYTSGSTGLAKGVMLSHENLLYGTQSVCQYLDITAEDRILCVLPFSFDYGLNQLLSVFQMGAQAVLLDYLMPRDIINACERHEITGLAGIPYMWQQLITQVWPPCCIRWLRFLTSSGGIMPVTTSQTLRQLLPDVQIHLMYGLTEAFRSTSLDPALVDAYPDSIGKPIPHADISIRRTDGSLCDDGEPGELVHAGPLVAQGYWNDPIRTAQRFRPLPEQSGTVAVWSGDLVSRDKNGLLYFRGRRDEMIKIAGYRISPSEIEAIYNGSAGVNQAMAIGISSPAGAQQIHLLVETHDANMSEEQIINIARKHLPRYMLPATVQFLSDFPLTANGKMDRTALRSITQNRLQSET